MALTIAALALAPLCAWADDAEGQEVRLRSAASVDQGAQDERGAQDEQGASSTAAANDVNDANDVPDYSEWTLDDLKREVEDKAAERDAIAARKNDCEARLSDVNTRLIVVGVKLPLAQSRADKAVIERYKKLRHSAELLDALLAAADINTLVSEAKYVESILDVSLVELNELRYEKMGLDLRKSTLDRQHGAISKHLDQVSAQLEAATAARDEAQRKADLVANANLAPDGADWGAGEEKFIEAWSPRIDAYLAGSPLEGQGATFAKAAWANHIDPRWSPAISNTESSKGLYCIRAHNAWGWGAADSDPYNLASEWGSWEEAINAHASGLARGYGYTISIAGAQAYCPSSWEEWYANTIDQMNMI